LRSSLRAFEVIRAFRAIFGSEVFESREHILLAGEWLLKMQNPDGGYSRKYSLAFGRDKSYIETTGYIIPTMFDLSRYSKDSRFRDSALRAGEWLLSVQNSDGSFSEIDGGKAFAFDTGQVLMGLNRLYLETKDIRFLNSAKRASKWLQKNQERDGSWKKVAYNSQKHTYYTRVASAMFEYGEIAKDKEIKISAMKMIGWTLANQLPNGFFRRCSFLEGSYPFLHTIIYVLEGLLDIYERTKEPTILKAILKNANQLKEINLNRDLLLCSEYSENYECVNSEKCMTGLAQWSLLALKLYKITGDEDFGNLAVRTIFYLKAKQLKGGRNLKGSHPASIPFWGHYGAFDFVNWGAKFFIDALLELEKYGVLPKEEQEVWVGAVFGSQKVVSEKFSLSDRRYLELFDLEFANLKRKRVKFLDLGCGRGKFMEYFKNQYPNWDILGVEPNFQGDKILAGSAYSIPLEDKSVDIIFTVEVLQHTYINEALKEIKRVLRDGGYLVIGERNPLSILGVLKPILEITNRWMYPSDSPFKEQWLSKRSWRKTLKRCGFELESINNIEGSGKKFVNRYFFIKVKV
jgi:SAM-dependent methyltransferase